LENISDKKKFNPELLNHREWLFNQETNGRMCLKSPL